MRSRQNYDDAPYGMVSKFLHDALYAAGSSVPQSHDRLLRGPGPGHARRCAQVLQDVLPAEQRESGGGGRRRSVGQRRVRWWRSTSVRSSAAPAADGHHAGTDGRARPQRADHAAGLRRSGTAARVCDLAHPGGLPARATLRSICALPTSSPRARRAGCTRGSSTIMQIAKDVSAYQASAQLGSTFEIAATAKKGHTPEELLKVIDEELGQAARPGADRLQEVDRARDGDRSSRSVDLPDREA